MTTDLWVLMEREEFVSIAALVRALQTKRRVLLRDLARDEVPFVRVGRDVLLHRDIVRARYYRHLPVTPNHSGHSA